MLIYMFSLMICAGDALDKNGRPVVYVFAAKHNKNERNLEKLEMMIIYMLELAIKRSRADEERIVICFDLSSFSYNCMGKKTNLNTQFSSQFSVMM